MSTRTTPELKPSPVIWLVILPGALIAAVYFAAAPQFVRLGLPSFVALLLAIAVVLVPFEIGILLREGKRLSGRYSIRGVVLWTKRVPVDRFILLVAMLLVWNFAVFSLLARFDRLLLQRIFSWFPNWALPPLNLYPASGDYSPSVRSAVILAGFILAGIVAPVVEELYFRGFLLPRMKFAGRHAPWVNAVLFSAYHFTLPWLLVSRAIAVVPLAYIADRTKNIYIGMVTHVLLNVIGALLFLGRH